MYLVGILAISVLAVVETAIGYKLYSTYSEWGINPAGFVLFFSIMQFCAFGLYDGPNVNVQMFSLGGMVVSCMFGVTSLLHVL